MSSLLRQRLSLSPRPGVVYRPFLVILFLLRRAHARYSPLFSIFRFCLFSFPSVISKKKNENQQISIFLSPLPEPAGALWTPPWVRVSDTPLSGWVPILGFSSPRSSLGSPFLVQLFGKPVALFSRALCGGPLGGGLESL
jgi:hypothetical protein